MKKITPSFLRSVEGAVDECSSIVQLRTAFVRYQTYVYNSRVYSLFLDRLNFLESRSVDAFISNQCSELREEIELERSILSVALPQQDKDFIEVNMTFYAKDGKLLESCLEELTRLAIGMSRGKKAEAARILGVEQEDFDSLCSNFEKYIKKVKKSAKK